MHWIDLVILLPLAWGLYKGVKRGFVTEAVSLFAVIAGIYLAVKLSDSMALKIAEFSGSDSLLLPALAFILILIFVVFTGYIAGKLLTMIIKTIALGLVNRMAGALFGTLKMLLVVSMVLFMVKIADSKLTIIPVAVKENSLLYTPLSEFATESVPVLRSSYSFYRHPPDQD